MLAPDERCRLDQFLKERENIFQLGGEATPFAVLHIDTGDHQPIALPYRLSPARKQVLKNELDKLLRKGFIEECESAWTARWF